MESSFAVSKMGLRPDDLGTLLGEPGPFLTLYLNTESAVPNAGQLSEKRWKSLRDQLSDAGVPDAVLEAVDPLVGEAHLSGQTLAVVAAPDGVRHVEHHPQPPHRDIVQWAALASVGPIIEWRQKQLPHIIVLADRSGADFIVDRGDSQDGGPAGRDQGEGDNVRSELEVEPSSVAGGTPRRNVHRAENAWADNARTEADTLTKLVDACSPRVVVAAGDVRAVQLLKEAVPDRVKNMMEVVEGARSDPGVSDELNAEVGRQVASVSAEDTVSVLHQLRSHLGQGYGAAEGAQAVLDALRKSQVELLVFHDDPDDDRTAWFGPDPGQVAKTNTELEFLGVERPRRARLMDVALLGALGTGASVRFVPHGGGPSEDLGALLRW